MMEQEVKHNTDAKQKETKEAKETLERKIGFLDRAKYFAAPVVLTVGAYFGPELKRKYDDLPKETQEKYRTIGLASTTVLGTLIAVASGYNLYKNYAEKKETIAERLEAT